MPFDTKHKHFLTLTVLEISSASIKVNTYSSAPSLMHVVLFPFGDVVSSAIKQNSKVLFILKNHVSDIIASGFSTKMCRLRLCNVTEMS